MDPNLRFRVSFFNSGRSAVTHKSGIERRRRLPRHLEDYPWLAVSRVNPGALCVSCVLLTASGSGVGGRSQGRGQIPGKLVTKPLDRFDELTGKDGSLTRHAKTKYHQDAILAFDFQPSEDHELR